MRIKPTVCMLLTVLSMGLLLLTGFGHADDNMIIVTRLEAQAGQEDAVRKVLVELVPTAWEIPGCIGFHVLQNVNSTSRFLVREIWKDRDAKNAFMATDAYKVFLEKSPYILEAAQGINNLVEALTCTPYTGPDSMTTSPSTVVTLCTAREGMTAAAKSDFLFLTERSHSEQGCYQYNLFQGIYDPSVFVEDEIWRDHNAVEEHMASDYFQYLWGRSPLLFKPIEGIDIPFDVMVCSPLE